MIRIYCVGKIKENYLKELIDDYLKRISKYHKLEIIEVKDNDNIDLETKELLRVIDFKNYTISLCIEGRMIDSNDFAKYIDSLFNYNGVINFIIGGSNGLSKEILDKCNDYISFSKFTFPHGLFRGILLEQIYRVFKINNNETYHK